MAASFHSVMRRSSASAPIRSRLALIYWNLTPWLGIPLGMAVGAIAAVIIGTPTFRLRGHYFALSMLAYPLAILYLLQYLGLQELSLPMHREHPAAYLEFIDTRLYTVVAMGLLAAGVVVCVLVENSRFGLALMAIRQNELAAEAAGINARQWKMRALVTSGAIAAAAGGLYACVLLVVTPDSVFGLLVSAQPVVVTLFGGVASIWGPVIGAAVLVPLAESLNAQLGNVLPGIQGVVYGAAIIVIILAAPDGLYWTIRDRWFRRALPPPPPALPAAAVPSRAYAAMVGSDALLQVQNLSRSFGGLRAVSEVSFTVARGEILGIIGPNGAGKTTLFNLLNGVLPADEGSATLGGQVDARPQGASGVPHGSRAHVPGGAQLSPSAVARQRRGRCLRRGTVGSRRYGGGGTAHCATSACCSSRRGRPGSSPTSNCG